MFGKLEDVRRLVDLVDVNCTDLVSAEPNISGISKPQGLLKRLIISVAVFMYCVQITGDQFHTR